MSEHYLLYYSKGGASMPVHQTLIELQKYGVTYEIRGVDLSHGKTSDPDLLKLNPTGRVPVLVIDGDKPISECVSNLLILAERHPEAGLSPPVEDSIARARYMETMILLANTCLPAIRFYYHADFDYPDGASSIKAMCEREMNQAWSKINEKLEGVDYLNGSKPGIADFLTVAHVKWSEKLENAKGWKYKNVAALVERVTKEESWKKVHEKEGIEFWPNDKNLPIGQ